MAKGLRGHLEARGRWTPLAVAMLLAMCLPAGGGSKVVGDAGASGLKAVLVKSNGTASGTFSGPNELVVRGNQCKGTPKMVVKIDGTPVMTKAVNSTVWTNYTVENVILVAGLDWSSDLSEVGGGFGIFGTNIV